MTEADRAGAFRQLLDRIHPGAGLVRARRLEGGVSAEVTALDITLRDGRTPTLLVRGHGVVDRAHNPTIARDEFRLLQIAQAHGLAAPKPFHVDDSCELFPIPMLVIEFIAGETEFAPADLGNYLAQMATELARIHAVRDSSELAFLPRQDKGFGARPAALDNSLDEGRIRDALEAAWPRTQVNDSVLLHGDYWPGNILWQDGRLAAVIDWEDARVGDPLSDLGNVRLERLWWFGPEAAQAFTRRYQATASIDLANLPYWDLCAALRPCGKLSTWGLTPDDERRMRELHRAFVTDAVASLSVK